MKGCVFWRILCRFQELLDESRRSKSDWINQGREESEVDLWPILKKETNILRLTNTLHPNQNQYRRINSVSCRLKRLGTEISSVQIIAPAINTMQDMVNTLKSLRQSCKALSAEERQPVSLSEMPICNSVIDQMNWMQKPEEEKLRLCQDFPVPKHVSIDENQEVNRLALFEWFFSVEDNILYEKFLQWLLDVDNYELFIRIKKFVSSVNSIVPSSAPNIREAQYPRPHRYDLER